MITSEKTDLLIIALNKAKPSFYPLKFDSVNPHYKNKFASLKAVEASFAEAFEHNGLALIHVIASIDGKYILTSRLCHISGQFMESDFVLLLSKNDMQMLGSAITYGKRYQTCCFLGISADADDDGNAASGKENQTSHYEETFEQAPVNVPSWDEIEMKEQKQVKNHAPKSENNLQATCHHKWLKSTYLLKVNGKEIPTEYCPTCRLKRPTP